MSKLVFIDYHFLIFNNFSIKVIINSLKILGSNLLDIFQHASWKDLSHQAQMQVATSLLIGLEENSFLLAGAVTREKTILQHSKNIRKLVYDYIIFYTFINLIIKLFVFLVLSVRILETRNVETEEFPTSKGREKWIASQDTIYLPRGALIGTFSPFHFYFEYIKKNNNIHFCHTDNSEGGLVRIVFVAFDRLEEILQPLPVPVITPNIHSPLDESVISENSHTVRHQQLNSEKDRDNITRVINSKVIFFSSVLFLFMFSILFTT